MQIKKHERKISIILIISILFTILDFNFLHIFANEYNTMVVKDIIRLNDIPATEENPHTFKIDLKEKGYDVSKIKSVDIINENNN